MPLRVRPSLIKPLQSRPLRIEELEQKRVLASMADVIFIADGSSSGGNSFMKDWLKDAVFAAPSSTSHPIVQALATNGITDVRYGLIGFGDSSSGGFAHSYLERPNLTLPI